MKIKQKIFLAALSLVIAVLSVFSLSGCDHFPADTEQPPVNEDQPTEDNTPIAAPTEDNEPTEAPTDDDAPEDNVDPDNQVDEDLIVALVDYLKTLSYDYELFPHSTADKIDDIKNGKQALHVAFDSSNTYFVCAYLDEISNADKFFHDHADEYTWVKYEKAEEIYEKYNDLSLVVAFQINPSLFVKDIMSEDAAVPAMEHFQPYEPQFNEGLNTKAADTFDETFIYLDSSDNDTVYHCTSVYYDYTVNIPCICLDGQYYVYKYLYSVLADGSRDNVNVSYDFGEYYDCLVSVMDTEKYTLNENGRTTVYGLITIDDFADIINK